MNTRKKASSKRAAAASKPVQQHIMLPRVEPVQEPSFYQKNLLTIANYRKIIEQVAQLNERTQGKEPFLTLYYQAKEGG